MEKCKEVVSGMMANQLRNHNVNANKFMPLNHSLSTLMLLQVKHTKVFLIAGKEVILFAGAIVKN